MPYTSSLLWWKYSQPSSSSDSLASLITRDPSSLTCENSSVFTIEVLLMPIFFFFYPVPFIWVGYILQRRRYVIR